MSEREEQAGTSGGVRWAIALAAVVVLVVAFIVLKGGGSSDDGPSQQAAQSATTAQQQPTTQQDTTTGTTGQQAAEPAPAGPTIRVKGGKPVGGVQKLAFHKGDRIRFRVVSDSADEAHFHGYDVEKELAPGRRVAFDVEATIEGRFEVELHHAGGQIARVDVLP
jgi:FtsP/CotA-like multicopper oxidase with cupredoxin domain